MKKAKIYYTSDTHGYIFSTATDTPNCILQCIGEFDKTPDTLIIDGGDTIQGSPFARYLWKDNCFPEGIPVAFNEGKYDYYTLGNHDFNYGYSGLSQYVQNMDATCIVANVKDTSGKLHFTKYIIHETESGLKIGLTGIVTDCVTLWEPKENLVNLEILDSYMAVKEVLAEMKGQCDVTICIYHGGFEDDLDTGKNLTVGNENIACKICKELSFDVLLTAHQHMEQEGRDYFGTHILQLPPNANKYAKIEIALGDTLEIQSEIILPQGVQCANFLEKIKVVKDRSEEWLSQEAGTIKESVRSREKADMAANGCAIADFCNTVQLHTTGADISVTSLPNQEIHLPRELKINNIMKVFPFSNDVMLLEMRGDILRQGLEQCATYFEVEDGQLVVSDAFTKPKHEHYNYDYFAGVSYDIHMKNPIRDRVRNVLVNGDPLDEDRIYRVAMSSYRATGTGGYEFYKECNILISYPKDIQDLILDYLANNADLEIQKLSHINIVM
ncbi:MAG: 5'-nucleotidase C-terminal domain-containing protein [Bacillota bacterium]